MRRIKVLLVGPYPPPYGGIAVQIYEWQRHLEKLGTFECSILNIGESRVANLKNCVSVHGYLDFLRKVHGFVRQGYLIHLVTNGHNLKSWLCSFACALVGARNSRRTVLVFGSGLMPEYINRAGFLPRLLIRGTIRLGGRLICRNEQMRGALIRMGAEPTKISILSGFLSIGPLGQEPLPQTIQAFLDTHLPVLGATVSVPDSGVLYPEYGIELIMATLKELRVTYPRIGAVIIGAGPQVRSQIVGFDGVDCHVMFTGPMPHEVVLGLMKQLTIFVRPTYFDGDSLSVREALALGLPVVASDTDYRPDGVILFLKGETPDLVEKLRYTLEHLEEVTARVRNLAPSRSTDRVLSLYRDLVEVT